jgi:hypothetical protein
MWHRWRKELVEISDSPPPPRPKSHIVNIAMIKNQVQALRVKFEKSFFLIFRKIVGGIVE